MGSASASSALSPRCIGLVNRVRRAGTSQAGVLSNATRRQAARPALLIKQTKRKGWLISQKNPGNSYIVEVRRKPRQFAHQAAG